MTSAAIYGLAGLELAPREAAFFREADPWGFILFARNVQSPDQVCALVATLRETVGRSAPVLIDQEGGRVARLRPPHWTAWRSHTDEIAEAGEMRLVHRYRTIGSELAALGIDVNCAPMLDVPGPGAHPIITDRVLGHGPGEIAARGRIVAEALLGAGVLPVVKHMPGHGRASVDSHLALPVVDAPLETLRATDFAPFRALSDLPLGMTGHVVFSALDPEQCATLSPGLIAEIRDWIGFDGCLMTDDISMGALSQPMEERVTRALGAGCDLILHCNGEMAEMETVASSTPALAGDAARRAAAALARRDDARGSGAAA